MLSFYLSSVITFMIIIFCTVVLFSKNLLARYGKYLNSKSDFISSLISLFILSAIPIMRVVVVVGIIWLAICDKETYDEIIDKLDENAKD